jgi:hypothetical protein
MSDTVGRVVNPQMIDLQVLRNNRRMEMLQKHIDRMTQRKQSISDDNIVLQAQKVQLSINKDVLPEVEVKPEDKPKVKPREDVSSQ